MMSRALPKYRRHIREEQKLLDLIARAHAVHDERVRARAENPAEPDPA